METLCVEVDELNTENKERKRAYFQESVATDEVASREEAGWFVHKILKTVTQVRKAKPRQEILANKTWSMLRQIGYPEMNIGQKFIIASSKTGETRHVDLFAKDDETVVIGVCRARDAPTTVNLSKELLSIKADQKAMANAVRKHYGHSFKPKIIWMLVTENIQWRKADEAQAEASNINIIREQELRYFAEIARLLGPAARYQFHAEFLNKEKIPALDGLVLPAIRTKLGGKTAYQFSADAEAILKIGFVNHRDLRDADGAPSYQRLLQQNRLKQIGRYLDNGGFFPNAIIANFRATPRFDKRSADESGSIQFGDLHLPARYKSLWIIDGQHRLYGYTYSSTKKKLPPITVAAFVGMPIQEEAELFTTINREQKQVSRKLLDELEGELKWDSPVVRERSAAIASRALDMLRAEVGGPFYDRIATPGLKADDIRCLTLPEIRKSILQSALIGRETPRDKLFVPGPVNAKTSHATLHRLVDILNSYFSLIREQNIERWERGRSGYLSNNFGVQGHTRLLAALITYMCLQDGVDANELETDEIIAAIEPYLDPVLRFIKTASDSEFENQFKVKLGSGGQKTYFYNLARICNKTHKGFQPEGLEEFLKEGDKEKIERTNRVVNWIQENVHGHVISVLKAEYGDAYLDVGVKNNDVILSATNKRQQDDAPARKSLDVYFEFIDLKKIVEAKERWPLFQKTLSIRLPEQSKNMSKCIKWFDEINKLRRVSAHPYERRYADSEIDLANNVANQLSQKLGVQLP